MLSVAIAREVIEHGPTSGVLSRTPKPVPPVVTIQSMSPESHQPSTTVRMLISSSGTMTRCLQTNPFCVSTLWIVGPERSADASAEAVSLTSIHALS